MADNNATARPGFICHLPFAILPFAILPFAILPFAILPFAILAICHLPLATPHSPLRHSEPLAIRPRLICLVTPVSFGSMCSCRLRCRQSRAEEMSESEEEQQEG